MRVPLLVSSLINLRYLTGVEMTAGLLLLKEGKRLLFVDNRYREKAMEGVKGGKGLRGLKGKIEVASTEELPKYLKRLKRVRFEADDVTVARLKRWKKKFRGLRFIPSEEVIEKMRRRKSTFELRSVEKACRITDRVMRSVPGMLRTTVTERKLAWEIEKLARELGADAMAFPTIVAFGPHTSRPHHSPTNRKLRKEDIIQIDLGVQADGYCSDCSRVFFTGKPTEEQREIFKLLVKVVTECTKRAKAGASNRSLDRSAREMLRDANVPGSESVSGSAAPRTVHRTGTGVRTPTRTRTLDKFFLHSLGHGVGLEIHEGVSLSLKARSYKLKPNEVITIEPGVYFSGQWGMRVEDTIFVTGKGGRRLTKARY